MLREMSTSYGRSPGGYVWAVAEPVAAIAFLTVVFSVSFRNPPIGDSFALFYATGILPFILFSDLHEKLTQALIYSRPLLAYPNVTFLDALLARLILNMLTKLLVAYIIFATVIVFLEGPLRLDLPLVLEGLALTGALALGIGTLNAFIILRIPLWQTAWAVLTRPLVIVSCTFILYENVPEPYQSWLWWNPLVHVIGMVRAGFYDGYDNYYVSGYYVMVLSMSCFALGLALLRRHHRSLFEKM